MCQRFVSVQKNINRIKDLQMLSTESTSACGQVPDFLDGGEGVGSGRDDCGSIRPSPEAKLAKSQQPTIPI